MRRLKFINLFLAATVWVGFTDPHFAFLRAFAQSGSSTTRVDVSSSMSMLPEKDGRLLIVVFKDGVPASGIVLRTPKGVLKTNSEGVVSVNLPGGQIHTIEIVSTEQKVNVNVVSDEETQVVVNLLTDKNKIKDSTAEVETPKVSATVKNNSDAPKKKVSLRVAGKGAGLVSEATVLFSGVDTVYKTDGSGNVNADLPMGTYSATVFHPNFQTYTISEFKVGEGQSANLDVSLKPAQNQLEEVVVLAPKIKGSLSALVEVRKQSSAVTDVLGAEQMARAGDSDAAASLRRVTGLTLVGGKFVYVRGLGERYSGVQMNSFSLPSPEPSRRVVPLDLFPTSIMESIIVQKSYSPDLPGEFGGGIIQLKTRSIPDKGFVRASLGMNYENTGNGLDHKGGSQDWLGFDDGTRELPAPIKSAIAQGKALQINTPGFDGGVSEAELTAMGKSLSNNYDLSNEEAQSLPSLSVSAGDSWKLSSVKVGTTGSLLYGQNTDQLNRLSRTFSVSNVDKTLGKDSVRSTDYTETETRVAGSFDVGFEIQKDHKLTASTFYLRNTTKLSQKSYTTFDSGVPTESLTMDFTQRDLWTQHFKGEHDMTRATGLPFQIDWRVGWADARRDSPDRRELIYNLDTIKNLVSDNTRRTWSDLNDTTEERGLSLSVPFKNSSREWAKVKVGVLELEKNRASEMTRLRFVDQNPGATHTSASEAYSNIGPDGFMVDNISANSNQADNYTGQQKIGAQYAMMEVSPWEQLSFQAGARWEKSKQDVRTFNYTTPGVASSLSTIDMSDVLPAYGIVWKPTDAIRGRIAYSETLARPDFREMSPVGYTDDETGYIVAGYPFLKGTVIKNIDHRWEYYFTSDEYASIGVFHKKFENPIEAIFLSGTNRMLSFRNAKAATNYGIELEGRVGARHFSRFLRRWTLLSNISFIKSEIEIDPALEGGAQTSLERPLQGQSPYVVNVQLQYDRTNWGFSSTLLYNIIGKRITEVGVNDLPDTYEQPFGQLDFTATKALPRNLTLSFRAKNLLNPSIESTQGPEIVREVRRGRTFGLVLGAVF